MNESDIVHPMAFQDGRVLVPFVVAMCLFTLASAMKNILHTPESRIIANLAAAAVVFCTLVLMYHVIRHEEPESAANNPNAWSAVIIIVAAVIAAYSF